jgi:hypothetical protein
MTDPLIASEKKDAVVTSVSQSDGSIGQAQMCILHPLAQATENSGCVLVLDTHAALQFERVVYF